MLLTEPTCDRRQCVLSMQDNVTPCDIYHGIRFPIQIQIQKELFTLVLHIIWSGKHTNTMKHHICLEAQQDTRKITH